MNRTAQLRKLLAQPRLLVAPFTYDAFTAKIAESVGFELIYLSGFGTAMSLGFPDVGLVTESEMVQNARRVAQAVTIPVIADADTGYGNPLNVQRAVRDYEAAGVAGLHLEDQVFPKRCGFFEGKDVIPLEEHVQKVRAAVDARTDPDFLIIARCDALAVEGWEGTVRRCRAYRDAGADMLFVDGIGNPQTLETYARELGDLPLLLNADFAPASQVEGYGFKVLIHRGPMFVVYRAVRKVMEELKEKGFLGPEWSEASPQVRREIAQLLGLDQVFEAEQRYRTTGPAQV